jgi:diguanylate cyclase
MSAVRRVLGTGRCGAHRRAVGGRAARPAGGLRAAAAPAWAGPLGWAVVLLCAGSSGGRSTVPTVVACVVILLAVVCPPATAAGWGLARRRGSRPATDELTGLVDRRGFLRHVDAVLAGPGAGRAALLIVDLDRFRDANDTLGHDAGDGLLVEVSERLSAAVGGAGWLARLGGDEFAVLVTDPDSTGTGTVGAGAEAGTVGAGAERVAVAVRDALRVPFVVGALPVGLEASIGLALVPPGGCGAGELLRHAGSAMREAKRSRVGHRFYGPDCVVSSRDRLRVRAELRGALGRGEISMRYQPKADLRTGLVDGVEALVRWDHPTDGVRSPDTFLPEMAQAGLMPALTARVLDLALADCARWRAAGHDLTVAVNVPAPVVVGGTLPRLVDTACERAGLPPAVLRLEITEDTLLDRRDSARQTIIALRGRGVEISLDDYGTGYCSLSYLRDLPVDELKLDGSFVTGRLDDPRAAAIVRSTVTLAHALSLRIVVEGVESAREWGCLSAWGCDEAQGYFMARPMRAGELPDWMTDWSQRTRPTVRPLAPLYVGAANPRGGGAVTPVAVRQRTRSRLWSVGFHAAQRLDSDRFRHPDGRRAPLTVGGQATGPRP